MTQALPTDAPTLILARWTFVPPLPIAWEEAFLDAVEDLRDEGIQVRQVGTFTAHADLAVVACMAGDLGDVTVSNLVAALRDQQASDPELRIGLIACDFSEGQVTDTDVYSMLCSDGDFYRRHGARTVETHLLRYEVTQWMRVTSKAKRSLEPIAVRGLRRYDSEAMIAGEGEGAVNPWQY